MSDRNKKRRKRSKLRNRADRYRSDQVIEQSPPKTKGRPSPAAVREAKRRADALKKKASARSLFARDWGEAKAEVVEAPRRKRLLGQEKKRHTKDEVRRYMDYRVMAKDRRDEPKIVDKRCKERPEPKKGGGGGRAFIPWCVRGRRG